MSWLEALTLVRIFEVTCLMVVAIVILYAWFRD